MQGLISGRRRFAAIKLVAMAKKIAGFSIMHVIDCCLDFKRIIAHSFITTLEYPRRLYLCHVCHLSTRNRI